MTERLKVPFISKTPASVTLAHHLTKGVPGGWTVAGLVELTGLPQDTVRRTLKKWVDMGLLVARRTAPPARWSGKAVHVYRVVLKRRRVLEGLAAHYPIG